jgi:hypothetical protein
VATTSSPAFEVGLLTYKVIGWLCCVVFVGASVGEFLARQFGPAYCFLLFVPLGAYLIASAGSILISEKNVEQRNTFGRYRIEWSDVRKIEVGNYGTIILHGKEKRFALAPPGYWSGKQKPDALALLQRKLTELHVAPYRSNVGDYKVHKNVRVSDAAV